MKIIKSIILYQNTLDRMLYSLVLRSLSESLMLRLDNDNTEVLGEVYLPTDILETQVEQLFKDGYR